MDDLTFEEAREAFKALADEIGPKASVSPSLNTDRGWGRRDAALTAFIRPRGYGGEEYFIVDGGSWRELIENSRLAWAERSDTHASNTIRDMALAIIRLTHALGCCTDAALRAEFHPQDVERYGEQACKRAGEMAGSGPFSIVPLAGANAEAA